MGRGHRKASSSGRGAPTPDRQRRGMPNRQRRQDRLGNAAILQQMAEQRDDAYDDARKAVIKVSPSPVQIHTFQTIPPPKIDNPDRIKAYVLDRLGQNDPLMKKANMEANLIVLAESMAQDGLPSFVPNVRASELEMETYTLTYKMYLQEQEAAMDTEQADDGPHASDLASTRPQPEQTLYFLYDSTRFNPARTPPGQWQNVVAQVIAYLRQLKHAAILDPARYGNVVPSITVSGYASPEGGERYNQGLSEDRASVVTEALAQELAGAGFSWGEYVILGVGRGECKDLIIY